MAGRAEYAGQGTVAVLAPQSNTTVEPEMGVLLPADVSVLTSRLLSRETDMSRRLDDYLDCAGATFAQLPGVALDLAYFACTGAGYGVGAERESATLAAAAAGRCEIISAAGVLGVALDALDARRIAIVSPYPSWLTAACAAYWSRGSRVVSQVVALYEDDDRVDIYGLRTATVLDAIERVDRRAVDVVLLAGTGMPTLAALVAAGDRSGAPLVSANVCMGWYATRHLAGEPRDDASLRAYLSDEAPWRVRFAQQFPRLQPHER